MIDHWKTLSEKISNTLIDYSNYKVEDVITSIPLYSVDEVDHYTEYVKFVDQNYNKFHEILKNGEFLDSYKFSKSQWIYSMYPDVRGYLFFPQFFLENIRQKIGSIETALPNITSSHHFFKYIEMTGKSPLNYRRIVELGGGLGDMALFFRNMGFVGQYIIYDLPEVRGLQEIAIPQYGVKFVDAIPDFQENTLFISTWGLSECPLELRNDFMKTLNPENWLIIYQREFEELNNQKYFESWEGQRYDMSFIPFDGGSEMICK